MPQTKPMVSIENVVASASVDQKIDLIEITKKFPDTEYHPEQFPGLVFRLTKPKTATLIFRTGKMVCTGAKSEEMAIKAVNTVVQQLRKGKVKIKKDAVITVQNIVASINLGGKIHLEKAARTLPRSMYEPEQFPGLIHRMVDPKTVLLLFASGKLVCTGAKKESDVYRSVHNLHSLLEEKDLMIYESFGCPKCNYIVYKGRFALMEVLRMDEDLDEFIINKTSMNIFRQIALDKGFITIQEDATRWIIEGRTSLEEVTRVIDFTSKLIS